MDFNQLREKHAQLIFEGFEVLPGENLKVVFNFLLTPDIKFKPEVVFMDVPKQIEPKDLDNLVFNLGMIELFSYWKAACPREVVIKAGFLDEDQLEWWGKLLIKGLGEFFYTNKIDFTKDDLVRLVILNEVKDLKIKSRDSSLIARNDRKELKDRDLILVGGGKDSAVTLDMIGKKDGQFNCLMVNPTQAALKITQAGGCQNPIIIKRTIDPNLLELNDKGYLNGHTPFSAYLAFVATLAAIIYDFKNIVVSNEASSNEGNVIWLGQEINHQYSKTLEFENSFRDYSQKYLAKINYFSFLRDKGELEISELFSKMPKYHKLFRSCNKGSKKGIWCGKCPKCVSAYLTLYPFLGEKTKEIFGKNLLEDESLIPIVEAMLRRNDVAKPFECVATVEEIKKAISMGIDKAKKEDLPMPKVLEYFKNET